MEKKTLFTIIVVLIVIAAGISTYGIMKASSKPGVDLAEFVELSPEAEPEEVEDPRA